MTRIAVIDYGCGNLKSVCNALRVVGGEPDLVAVANDLKNYSHIVLPGVGAYATAMASLELHGFRQALEERRDQQEVFFLGICLGMQLLCNSSQEGGYHRGLGWVDAEVVPLANDGHGLKIPHMGWNALHRKNAEGSPVFSDIRDATDVYFVHSYCVRCNKDQDIVTTTHYGDEFVSAFRYENIWGMQFHPEKSQGPGLSMLQGFLNL